MRLTDATVTYGRTMQPAQFESKKAEVTLSIVPDDEDSFLTETDIEAAGALAQKKCLEMIGLQSAPATASKPKAADKKTVDKKADTKPAEEPVTMETVEEKPAPEADKKEDNLFAEEEPAPQITPQEIMKQVTSKISELQKAGTANAADLAKGLMAEMCKDDGLKQPNAQVKAIVDQGEAQAFLDKLAELK